MRLKTALSAAIAFTALTAAADEYSGEKTLGLQTGYITYNQSAVAGIEFTYRFNRNFRLAPSVNYVFRHKSVDALMINLNAQVLSICRKMGGIPAGRYKLFELELP